MSRVLVIDNYDSFTYNLFQFLGELGCDPIAFKNDEIGLAEIEEMAPEGIVISPGPGRPERERYFGICLPLLRQISPRIPTLGVCLGHQGIGVAYGGKIEKTSRPYHGKVAEITHEGEGLLRGLPRPFSGARYHSLTLEEASLPDDLRVTARAETGEVMAIEHSHFPIYGLQFHPESILTEGGKKILANFLDLLFQEGEQ